MVYTKQEAVIRLLEARGLVQENIFNKVTFVHPQWRKRRLVIEDQRDGRLKMRFAHPSHEFTEHYALDNKGCLLGEPPIEKIEEIIKEFFTIEERTPLPGSPAFEKILEEVMPALKGLAMKYSKEDSHNYDLNYEDLLSAGRIKTYRLYYMYGDRPPDEFRRRLIRAVINEYRSLNRKHYLTQRRRGEILEIGDDDINIAGKTRALTDELEKILADSKVYSDEYDSEEYALRLEKYTPLERVLIETLYPPEQLTEAQMRGNARLQSKYRLDQRRRAKKMALSPGAKVPDKPRYRLDTIARINGCSYVALQKAYHSLSYRVASSEWVSKFAA